MSKSKKASGFAASLSELEAIANRLEDDDISLEQSLQDFEKGVQLIREAQKSLRDAEQKVKILLEQDGEPVATDLKGGADPE